MLLKRLGALFRRADQTAAKVITASLDAKAEQMKEYEKRFEPQSEPILQAAQSLAAVGLSAEEAACAIAKVMVQKPKPLRHLTNN